MNKNGKTLSNFFEKDRKSFKFFVLFKGALLFRYVKIVNS